MAYPVVFIISPAGRHFCLKCLITSVEAKVAPADRSNRPTLRSLESMAVDFERFTAAGGDVEKAKNFNNVISRSFFDIPLEQVSYVPPRALIQKIFGLW